MAHRHLPLAVALVSCMAAPAAAQSGVGVAGAQVLQLPAGSRAPALAGAYTAGYGDADLLFYNPAGAAALDRAVSVAYQSYFEDIVAGSGAAVFRLGALVVGAGLVFLDAGEVAEIVPDPAYGGQRGMETGQTVTASENAARFAAAASLLDDRLRLGAAAGVVSSDLAGIIRSAPFFDIGAQYAVRELTVGAVLKNLGGAMTSDTADDATLPTEARFGASYQMILGQGGLGAALAADVFHRMQEGTSGLAVGLEGGLMATPELPLAAVVRAGVSVEAADEFLAPLRLGAGVAYGDIAVDYTYQSYDVLGSVHRFGLRWVRR